MNIGAWPMTIDHQSKSPITSKESNQLFWTKAFLQTNTYDEKRYRQIGSNACERIVSAETKSSSRPSSVVVLSLSETSTRVTNSKNNHSTPQTITLPITNRKKSSYTRFSCYLKSHQVKTRPKINNNKKKVPKNNNHSYNDKTIRENRNKLCEKCFRLIRIKSNLKSSSNLCQSCDKFIQNSTKNFSRKQLSLTKSEESELRQIIELVIEEFQDHFSQTLNLSIKQMTNHLLANINLFYKHYQHEFEQLTKTYRLTFLERFIELMNKCPTKPIRNSITHPPDVLSMSSLSGSLATEKDRSNSLSLSTTSNQSMKIFNKPRYPIQHSSSKKTFVINRNRSSSIQLLDAYRFRETLKMNHHHSTK